MFLKRLLFYFINFIYYTILAALIILVVVIFFSGRSFLGDYRLLVVQSGSMEPAIHTGAVVVVKPQADYVVGDIITYRANSHNDKTVTHRIQSQQLKNGQTVYVTKGDANEDADFSPISSSRIVGKVIINVPYVGYAVAAVKTKWGILLVIILPAALIITDQFKRIIKEIKKMKAKKSRTSESIKISQDSKKE